jgi:hypothetical protein
MTEHQDPLFPPAVETEVPQSLPPAGETPAPPVEALAPVPEATATANGHAPGDSGDTAHWHAEAGRKGGRRVHQLIEQGRLYEKEHGLKRGRQRLRQLLELGKMYEKEHGLKPELPRPRRQRLSRGEREQLLRTLLQCLLHIARPSFRAPLEQLVEALAADDTHHAA